MQILQCLLLCAVISGHFQQYHSGVESLNVNDILSSKSDTITTKVLIIGAGISGLEAARLLQQNGIKTVVLEARNRTGVRIWSIRSKNGLVLDMGARYIHGIYGSIPSGLLTNPLWDFTRTANISTCNTEQHDFLGSYPSDDSISSVQTWYDEFMIFVREATRISSSSSSNMSFAYYVDLFAQQKDFSKTQRVALNNFVYFTLADREGAELDDINAKNFLDLTGVHYGAEPVICDTGYMTLTDHLSRNLTDIRLEQVVTKINYTGNVVEVSTKDGQMYRADFVLITVPLGVLKWKQIEFNPQLPQWKLDAINRIGFGYYEKVILLWDRSWWNATNFYYFRPSSKLGELRYWVTANKWKDKPSITCTFAGNIVSSLKWTQNQDEIVKEIRDTLQKMFPTIVIPSPTEVYMSNWNEDSFSYGSYSYISVNQMHDDPFRLSEPIQDRLLFAGEATSTDTYGYAHGVMLSARREVTRLLFVYDLLPKQNSLTSQSTMTTSLHMFIMISFISLFLYSLTLTYF